MKYAMIFVILSLCANLSVAQSPNEAKPSFDCTKAKSKVENLICSVSELARLDRMYSKLYFATLKAIPNNTPQGQKTREKLKLFNKQVMESRNFEVCYYSSLKNVEYDKNEEFLTCIKDIYLEAIVSLAYNMLGEQTLLKFIEKGYISGDHYYTVGRYNVIENLADYHLYDRFFDAKHKNMILEFFNFSAQTFYWITRGGMSVDVDYNEIALEHRKYYNNIHKAFKIDKKINKLLDDKADSSSSSVWNGIWTLRQNLYEGSFIIKNCNNDICDIQYSAILAKSEFNDTHICEVDMKLNLQNNKAIAYYDGESKCRLYFVFNKMKNGILVTNQNPKYCDMGCGVGTEIDVNNLYSKENNAL